MHDEPVSQNELSPTATELFDQRIVRVLETVPDPLVPADFAPRVASQLPARRPVSLTPTHYGDHAMLLGIVATLAAMVVLALHTTGRASFGLPESLLLTQFIILAIWLSVRRHSMR